MRCIVFIRKVKKVVLGFLMLFVMLSSFLIVPPGKVFAYKSGGLVGEYFNGRDLSGAALTRQDSNINFDWSKGSPDSKINTDSFSARWTGKIEPQYTEAYTFYSYVDDGVRLWINGQLIIDKWFDQTPTEWNGTINLTAGQKYDIKMEYYENTTDAIAKLYWSSPSQPKEIVPSTRFYVVPYITNVNSSAVNGSYKAGSTIPILVTFSENVIVTGTPQLSLNTAGKANYSSGSGTNTLIFNYVAQEGDISADLDYNNSNALSLNGGTIKGANADNAVLTLPGSNYSGSLGVNKDIITDAISPMVGKTNISENRITSNTSDQERPEAYGDKIVWTDNRNGNSDIYMYNLSTQTETQITTDLASQEGAAIYGDKIVWEDNRNGNWDIYLYNLTTKTEARLTTDSNDQRWVQIYGDTIVWNDNRNGNWDIYMYNLSTSTETQLTSNSNEQSQPDVWGDKIVWHDVRSGNGDIYMYNTTTHTETVIVADQSAQDIPKIYGNRVVYSDLRKGNWDIYMYDISTSREIPITTNTYQQYGKSIDGDIITWTDERNESRDVYMFNLKTGKETRVTAAPNIQGNPFVFGDKMVWEDNRNGNWDIYMATLTKSYVTSNAANGTYKAGDIIPIEISFSKNVIVTGMPKLTMNTGGTASCTGGSGTDTLSFSYTVQSGDTVSRLDYKDVNALLINGGTIRDTVGNDANLLLPVPGASGSLSAAKSITIDGGVPVVSNVTSDNNDGSYQVNATIDIKVVFTKNVIVTGTPRLTLNSGGSADYISGSGTSTLIFRYTVKEGEASSDLDCQSTTALTGTIKDSISNNANLALPVPGGSYSLGGNKNIKIDAPAKSASIQNVTSDKPNGYYSTGEIIDIKVVLDKNVEVTGTPKILLNTGKESVYFSGSGSNTLVFRYTVQAGDSAIKLDYLSDKALDLSNATIKDMLKTNINTLLPVPGTTHSLSANKTMTIDTLSPIIKNVSLYRNADQAQVKVLFDESVNVTGIPHVTLDKGRKASYSGGSGSESLFFDYPLQEGDSLTNIKYETKDFILLNSGSIKDKAGNDANLSLNPDSKVSENIIKDSTQNPLIQSKGVAGNNLFGQTIEDAKIKLYASIDKDTIHLGWNPILSANSEAVGYKIFRLNSDGASNVLMETNTYISDNDYYDTNVTEGSTYVYICKAYIKGDKEIASSNELKVTISGMQAYKNTMILTINDPMMLVNGRKKEIDPGRNTKPVIVNNRTILPIRVIVEEIGGKVSWNDRSKKVTVVLDSQTIELWIGKKEALVNGEKVSIDVAPAIINARTMIPLRFVAESLGCQVQWDEASKKVTIKY